jgi:EmrB/QacA subfamily drug resistance transporter
MAADAGAPPRAASPWPVILVVCLGAFVGQVDASIVQLALPTLERTFDSGLAAVGWVSIGYSLAFAAALPVFARLAEMGHRKVMYVCGFALFGLFSALCGFAPSLGWLVAFRVLQGASGALLGANSIVILVLASGAAMRGRALGIFATAQAVGVCLGPALGGIILGSLSWHWIFWVTVPVAIVATAVGWRFVPTDRASGVRERFDVPGALLLVPALAASLLAVTELQSWSAAAIVGVLVVVAALGVGFVVRERRTAEPLLQLGLFRSRAFSGGTVAVLLSYALLYGMFFAMSFALVNGYADSPLAAGLHLAVVPLALGLVAPFAGGWADRHPRPVMIAGMVMCVVALVPLAANLRASGSMTVVLVALAVYGAGLGCFIAPNNNATLKAAPPEHAGQAGGLLNLMRAFGTATGVALMSSLLAWRLAAITGVSTGTHTVAPSALLDAVRQSLVLLAVLAVAAAITANLRDRRPVS